MQTEVKVAETSPVWLEGVRFPAVDANLSEAVRIIEGMLAARRDQQLLEGLRFYTPEFREQLRIELGIDDAELERTLAAADVRGAPPSLRSVEFVHASGASMSVRAGYSNGGSELYRFVRVEERWLVEGIERAAR